ncbi:uncharacterized protein N7484_004249 [Penicillium longicatenatum]|uniref:uncharacterized protein n=1 Tax=Penicillium longicatenatum TaxID=1561947 RepID=UPI002546F5BD|nr:uncharacterized protein N7484_004249 [Penicillium longicatenatum]KAJ5650526.1 hypothetical protein N7484_004249 [Penicillium longicatenatum]
MPLDGKRIILCLDGTWVNSDKGYNRPTAQDPNETSAIPTNVTRVYRSLRKRGFDGESQVMYYHPGVGSTGGVSDSISGGVFGTGVAENIREAYSFVATNYEPGDEIILLGFSRGAFTARGVASLIDAVGLLNSDGMEMIYPIFKDAENMENSDYKDKFPTIPFPNKPRRPNSGKEYKRRLEDAGLTRVYNPDGHLIKIRCIAVWETVGSLALALDEDRTSFAPAVWERPDGVHTDLRQVWFCGAHSNVGGGLPDQELANIALAWMMDQLTSIGVAFYDDTIDKIFERSVRYFFDHPHGSDVDGSSNSEQWRQWADRSVYDEHKPVRPWGLGEIVQPDTGFYHLAGKTTRTPGQYRRIDPETGKMTSRFLVNTNERIHRSVRIRLDLGGLGYDDVGLYKCKALLKKGPWDLERVRTMVSRKVQDPDGDMGELIEKFEDDRWGWIYAGPAEDAPLQTILMEEPLGPYEKRLLRLSKGRPFYKALLEESRSF